jgi:hypothetical protein
MDNHINFNPEDPSHLVEAIIMEKYIFLKKITHVKEINFDQFEVIYENVLLIAEGHQVNELSYFPMKEVETPQEILKNQENVYKATMKNFSDVIEVIQKYLENEDLQILSKALEHFENLNK